MPARRVTAHPRVLVVLEAGDRSASGLVRGLVYEPEFERRGIETRYVSRLDPRIEKLAKSTSLLGRALRRSGVTTRLQQLNQVRSSAREDDIVQLARAYDVVYLLKTDSYRLVEQLRAKTKARIVFDLNDALWLPRFAGFGGGRLVDILREVDAVISDNEYGLDFARAYNGSLYMVPEHPQLEVFDEHRAAVKRSDDEIVLGWIGSPATTYNLYAIWEPLERLFANHPNVTLRLVGTGSGVTLPPFERVRFTKVATYDQQTMVREVLGMHIGLYPLFDVQDSWARGIMKATIYMCGGAAVMCSAIGASTRLVQDGENGMLGATPGEWTEKLGRLVEDAALRKRVAANGLALMRREHTLEKSFTRLWSALSGT